MITRILFIRTAMGVVVSFLFPWVALDSKEDVTYVTVTGPIEPGYESMIVPVETTPPSFVNVGRNYRDAYDLKVVTDEDGNRSIKGFSIEDEEYA